MNPTVARMVHLVADDGECLAAIVTKVPKPIEVGNAAVLDSDEILLTVFAPSGPTIFSAKFGEPGTVSTWHWPERVE